MDRNDLKPLIVLGFGIAFIYTGNLILPADSFLGITYIIVGAAGVIYVINKYKRLFEERRV